MLTDANFGVVILCPDCNSGSLKTTATSLRLEFPAVKYVAAVGKDAHVENVKSLQPFCRVVHGGKTITSLIDAGMTEVAGDWKLIVMAGSPVRYTTLKKYRRFATSDKDILYPVVDSKYVFDEASINGILMREKTYEDVGPFGDGLADLREAKLLWAARAVEKSYQFKALVGARLC
jgi:hypothetical protein